MALDREAIFAALSARLAALQPATVQTYSRRFRDVSELQQAEQPALFLCKSHERAVYQQRGLPATWTLQAALYLYARNDGDPYAGPSTQINTLLEAVETALEWQPSDGGAGSFSTIPGVTAPTTLGGLVSYARIIDVTTDEGTLGNQAVAIVTVEMLATE